MYTSVCTNQKVHALADHVPSMLACWDADLRCRFANRAYKDWFGVDSSRMLGTPIQNLLGPKLFGLNEPYMRRALAGEEQVFERLIVGPDQVARHSLARYTPEVEGGAVVGFFVEVTDISALKTTEFALQRQIEQLEKETHRRTMGRQGRVSAVQRRELLEEFQRAARAEAQAEGTRRQAFLAQIAHELRNSLAPLKAGAMVLSQASTRPPQVVEKVSAMVSRQLGLMSRLVDDMFDLSALEAGVLTVKPKRVDLGQVIQQALAISMPLLDDAGHELVLEGFDQPLPVDADAVRLIQVFSNIFNNAAKYTPPGGRISVTAAREGPNLKVDVRDTGIGMPPGAASSVFGMFLQLAEASDLRQGGLGIGLALVRQIVQAHGGSVSASSEGRGRGSTFTVLLPAVSARGNMPAPS